MNKALYETEHLIAVLSPSYQEALFAAPERAAIFSDDPQGLSRRLIPVGVKKFKPGGLLKAIVYIDLVPHLKNRDIETARTALFDWVREGRAKPKCEPVFQLYCEE